MIVIPYIIGIRVGSASINITSQYVTEIDDKSYSEDILAIEIVWCLMNTYYSRYLFEAVLFQNFTRYWQATLKIPTESNNENPMRRP